MIRCRRPARAITIQTSFPYLGRPAFLGTTGKGSRPHAAGMGTLWLDDVIYFTSGPGTRKSRDLELHPACTISASVPTIDIVFKGEAVRVTDGPTLEHLAALCREADWPVQVAGDTFTGP